MEERDLNDVSGPRHLGAAGRCCYVVVGGKVGGGVGVGGGEDQRKCVVVHSFGLLRLPPGMVVIEGQEEEGTSLSRGNAVGPPSQNEEEKEEVEPQGHDADVGLAHETELSSTPDSNLQLLLALKLSEICLLIPHFHLS